VIDAGMELTASGGGSFLKLDPSGVTVSGATIKMNSGGAPGSGSGLKVLASALPNAADKARAGAKPKLALANTQLMMARKARQIGASRCPICEACRDGVCAAQPAASTASTTAVLSVVEPQVPTSAQRGPGKWVTQEIVYDGMSNSLKM